MKEAGLRPLAAELFDTPTAYLLRRRYARGLCLWFASAVAGRGGPDLGAFDFEGHVAHAFLVCEARGPGPRGWTGADATGLHPAEALGRAYAHPLAGAPRWAPRRPLDPRRGDWGCEPPAALVAVAGCLPWLHPFVPARARVCDGRAAQRRLDALFDAILSDDPHGLVGEGLADGASMPWEATRAALARLGHGGPRPGAGFRTGGESS